MAEKIALVVGAGPIEGVGGALALCAAAAGHHIFVTGRTAERVEKLAAHIRNEGGSAAAHAAGITDEAQVEDMFKAIDSMSGSLDFVG